MCVCVCVHIRTCACMRARVCVLVSSSTDLVALITVAEYLQHYPVSECFSNCSSTTYYVSRTHAIFYAYHYISILSTAMNMPPQVQLVVNKSITCPQKYAHPSPSIFFKGAAFGEQDEDSK